MRGCNCASRRRKALRTIPRELLQVYLATPRVKAMPALWAVRDMHPRREALAITQQAVHKQRGPAKCRTALFAIKRLGRQTGADRSVLVRVKSSLIEFDCCEGYLNSTAASAYLNSPPAIST